MNVELMNFFGLVILSWCMLGEKNCYILLFGMFGYLMNISVGGYLFILKFNIKFYFILFIFLQDIRGEKNINVNWTRWITNWWIMELMNIEKKQSPSFIHPSHPIPSHPSILYGAMVGAAYYIWPKNTCVYQHPPSSFLQKIWKFFMQGKRMVWMVNACVDGQFSSLPSRIYHGCMVNLPCSMDCEAFVHGYHGEFTM